MTWPNGEKSVRRQIWKETASVPNMRSRNVNHLILKASLQGGVPSRVESGDSEYKYWNKKFRSRTLHAAETQTSSWRARARTRARGHAWPRAKRAVPTRIVVGNFAISRGIGIASATTT